MALGGIQKNSLIDYPGKISCVLFLSGCNFTCPYCHNPDLVRNTSPVLLEEAEVCRFLESRRNFLDGVVVSGGEPTIYPGIESLLIKIKKIGYPIKLDTNGSRPQVIKKLLSEGLVDYIAMDIKTDPDHYSFFTKAGFEQENILSSIKIIMDSASDYEFRTTCVKPFISEPVIEKISRIINGANLYALQHFQNKNVLNPQFFIDKDSGFNDEEFLRLKLTAEPFVENCIIR